MEETIIKWSSKKIVLSLILYLLELALLLWIELSRRSTCGIGGFNSLYRFLNHHRLLHFVSTFATAFF